MLRTLSCAVLTCVLAAPRLTLGQSCTPPNATMTFSGSANDGFVCGGLSLTAEVPDAGPGATYAWSLSSQIPAFITSGDGTRSTTLQTRSLSFGSPTVGISVTVTNSCGTTSSQRQLTTIPLAENYSVNFNPPRIFAGPSPIGCTTTTYTGTLTANLVAPPERTYQWQITGGQLLSGQGTTQITVRDASPGTLGWSVIQQDRCSALGQYHGRSGSWEVVNPVEQSPQVLAPPFVGSNSTDNAAFLTGWQALLLHGPRISSLVWSIEGGSFSVPGEAFGAMPVVFTAGATGSVKLTATLSDYCGHTFSPSATIPITQQPLSISAPNQVCSNEQAEASVADIPGATYAWTVTGGSITSGQGTSRINFVPSAAGVNVSVNVNSMSASKSIDVMEAPDATIITDSSVQPHSINHARVNNAGPNAAYSWSVVNGSLLSSPNVRQITYAAGGAGPVQLYVAVTANSRCTTYGSATVVAGCPAPIAPATVKIDYLGLNSGCSQANGIGCSRGETVRFSVLSQEKVLGDCDDVHWTLGSNSMYAAWFEQHFDATGVYLVSVAVQNHEGSATAQSVVTVGVQRRRATGH